MAIYNNEHALPDEWAFGVWTGDRKVMLVAVYHPRAGWLELAPLPEGCDLTTPEGRNSLYFITARGLSHTTSPLMAFLRTAGCRAMPLPTDTTGMLFLLSQDGEFIAEIDSYEYSTLPSGLGYSVIICVACDGLRWEVHQL